MGAWRCWPRSSASSPASCSTRRLGAIVGAIGAAGACVVISDLVFGASRREGSGGGAIGFIVALAALVVLAIALLIKWVIIAIVLALIWLGWTRYRRAQRKHAGLRVLR